MAAALFKWFSLLLIYYSWFNDYLPAITICGDRHPFYVSVTELNHNQKENIIEVSCKMFADDFENALKARYKMSIDVTHPKDTRQLDKLVYDYVQKHIHLKVNEKPVALEFIGFEKESEAVWCYLQVKDIRGVRKLEIMNNLLYEMYTTQIGIVHASVGGHRKSIRLNFPETNASFEW